MSVSAGVGTAVYRHARRTPKGKGMSYGESFGTLMERAQIGEGAGWDVVDLRLDSGEESSAYAFDLFPVLSRRVGWGAIADRRPGTYRRRKRKSSIR